MNLLLQKENLTTFPSTALQEKRFGRKSLGHSHKRIPPVPMISQKTIFIESEITPHPEFLLWQSPLNSAPFIVPTK